MSQLDDAHDLPRVDVVIATHNRPGVLRTAVDAVMNQTYAGPIRCTVVFDRATPDPSLVRHGDLRSLQVMENRRSPGLAGARNTGILAGDAELVAFCDDDDEWMPDKVQRQVALMTDTGAATSVTGITILYESHSTVRVPRTVTLDVAQLVRRRAMEAHPSTVMVRRRTLLDGIGLVDEAIPGSYGEDYDWILRAAEHGDIVVVQEPLARILWGHSHFSRDWGTIVEAIDYLVAKHPAFSTDRRALARLYGRQAFALAASGRRRSALKTSLRSLRMFPGEQRGYLAGLAASGLVSPERMLEAAHRRGRGI